jgi:prepilin-type N-terminal cleavage/methylation domain-containing protein
MKSSVNSVRRKSPSRGFSLIEVMVAMIVLTVGMVAMLGVFATAIASTRTSQVDMLAKQIASEAIENIFTARNTTNVQWLQIQNVGAGTSPDGIFLKGFQPVHQAGPDGIIGTADDQLAPNQSLTLPGPDGIVGTADDQVVPLTNYQRKIDIVAVTDTGGNVLGNLRQITITVQYYVPGQKAEKTYTLNGFISQYR